MLRERFGWDGPNDGKKGYGQFSHNSFFLENYLGLNQGFIFFSLSNQ